MLTEAPEQVGRFEEHTLPNGEVVYYEEKHHGYYGEIKPNAKSEGGYSRVDKSRLPGASTISKHLSDQGDGLLYWAAGLDQQGIATLVERDMNDGADLTWLTDADAIKRRLREGKLEWKNVRDQMAEWGTNVHELTFLALAKGAQPSLADLSDEERGFGQAVFAWWRDRSPKPIAAEKVTVNHALKYAGRFDLLCDLEIGGEVQRVLVDAKTRTSGKVRRSDHVQVVGYDLANQVCGIGESDRQLALILMSDGTYRESWSEATPTEFYAALTAYESGKQLEKRMGDAAKTREAVLA